MHDALTCPQLAELINLTREAWGEGQTREQGLLRRKLAIMHMARAAVDVAAEIEADRHQVLSLALRRKAGEAP